MLILTRRIGETLKIGDDVSLTILGVNGSQVRIGTSAPSEIEVHREEIYNRIHNAGSAQSKTQLDDSPATKLRRGIVTFIDHHKGFGFISAPGNEDGLFFHASGITEGNFGNCYEGSEVEFQLGRNQKGLAATNIILR